MSHLIVDVARARVLRDVGRKAEGLHWLAQHGHAIPRTWVAPAAVVAGLEDDARRAAVRSWLTTIVADDVRYAVRSSADVEDGHVHSFAGQFLTVLDVEGVDEVLEAMRTVAASVGRAEVVAYANGIGVDPVGLRMAVIVQEMVRPVVSGVAFSKNPVTGLDEVVIEAVEGSGEQIVQEGRTPDRWVYRWGDYLERPGAPVLEDHVVAAVIRETRSMATERGRPVDLEWVWDGRQVCWVQIRPITGLDGIRLYSNRIAREVLPGLVKPLVWSVNVPVVNRAWIQLFEELVGPTDIAPEQLARQFAYRAYFDMARIGEIFELLGMPRESLELLLGLPRGSEAPRFRPAVATMRHVPRMLAAGARLAAYGPHVRGELRDLASEYAALEAADLVGLAEPALLERVDRLMAVTERAAYANIVTPILMNLYGKLLERRLAAAGLDPRTTDPAVDRADHALFDPREALDELADVVAELPPEDHAALAAEGLAALGSRPGLAQLAAGLETFAGRFGHLAASGNDFSSPSWREDPEGLLRMVMSHPRREHGSSTLGWDAVAPYLPALERPVLRSLWVRAGAFRVYREAVSFRYTRGYVLFRPTLLALGQRFVDRGLLSSPDDIFYLTLEEVRELVSAGDAAVAPTGLVASRLAEMAEAESLELPEIIYGDDFQPRSRVAGAGALRGVPTSRGHHRGAARVVRDTGGFAAVQRGDVIVIPHSDVAWTPLFARAGAVVAESGGLLSHSSIVAREYGIPCVVSLDGACARIPDGALVAVDGYTGEVVIESPAG